MNQERGVSDIQTSAESSAPILELEWLKPDTPRTLCERLQHYDRYVGYALHGETEENALVYQYL